MQQDDGVRFRGKDFVSQNQVPVAGVNMWLSPADMQDILGLLVCKECGALVVWNRKYKCWQHKTPKEPPALTCLDELNNRRLDMVVRSK